MSVAWRGTCLCFSYLCYFGDAFVMQYISPINLLKASLVYGKRLKICVRCTLLVLHGLELSQAAASVEVSYTMALICYLHFAFLQRFDSNW